MLNNNGTVTVHDIKVTSLLYNIQHSHFKDIFIAIKHKRRLCLLKQLGLQIYEFEILHCLGRYVNADIREKAKYPKLLPCKNYCT